MSVMDAIRPAKKVETVEPPPAPAHKGVLYIGGAGTTVWDTADPITVEEAKIRFRNAIRAGYAAQIYGGPNVTAGYSGEISRNFDPEADEIRMTLPYAGG